MAGFLYFAPARPRVDRAWVTDHGPAYAFDDDDWGRMSQGELGQGPGDQRGCLFARRAGEPHALGYAPDRQRWAKAAGSGEYWLGYDTAEPPTPAHLERAEIIDGHLVRLGDGQQWLVPVARMFSGGTALPQAIVLGPNGEKVLRALPAYVAIARHADRVATDIHIGMSDGWDIAVEALALNYRIGPDEASLLQLLTTPIVPNVLEALVDVPTLRAVARQRLEAAASKKNAAHIPDGSNTDSGAKAD